MSQGNVMGSPGKRGEDETKAQSIHVWKFSMTKLNN